MKVRLQVYHPATDNEWSGAWSECTPKDVEDSKKELLNIVYSRGALQFPNPAGNTVFFSGEFLSQCVVEVQTTEAENA